eukprot:CAMPEP_0195638800 /NCGR_PEP_ID=MMETSP0815-20121206/25213_1 /TAXON_ID=97485 /ORGANISM="Prymnesium parvum, Strain Texoma1" /LENGTH=78 /DNA_ID=CAMNT_0040781235 /DNA_START=295 /DNA_END=528 /DNA_ORIENTATION=+
MSSPSSRFSWEISLAVSSATRCWRLWREAHPLQVVAQSCSGNEMGCCTKGEDHVQVDVIRELRAGSNQHVQWKTKQAI